MFQKTTTLDLRLGESIHFESRIVEKWICYSYMCLLYWKTSMLASWPGLLLTGIIADCRWNAMECSCHKISYEKVEEGEGYFRECARSENWVVAVLLKHFLVSERIFSMAQINVTALTFLRPECIHKWLCLIISHYIPSSSHFGSIFYCLVTSLPQHPAAFWWIFIVVVSIWLNG